MRIYKNKEIKIFSENLISFIKYKFFYFLGFIEKNGEPNRCSECLSTKFTYKTTDTINSIVCEQEMLCSNCGKIHGYFAYGHWDYLNSKS